MAIRDHLGVVVNACSRHMEGSFSPYIVECLTLWEGLFLAKNLRLQMKTVETDVVCLGHKVQNPLSISDDSHLIADIVNFQSKGIFSSCAYVPKGVNGHAHLLLLLFSVCL